MLWIGGAPGAGKSTLAWRLSRTWDLPLHSVDLWSYDHQARLPERESLDEELARGPEAAADAVEAVSRARRDQVLADIAARDPGPVPALVEGPQLSPDLATRLPAGCGVWLVPDPERTRLARQERLARRERLARQEALAGQPTASRTRAEAVLARDAILAARIQRTAAQAHRPVVHVPAARTGRPSRQPSRPHSAPRSAPLPG